MSMQANQVIDGTYGRLYINNQQFAQVTEFEAKIAIEYTKVDIAEDLATHQKAIGWSGSGTMKLNHIDSSIAILMDSYVKTGIMPQISMVGRLNDPASQGCERVQFLEVTFDDFVLMHFKTKSLTEESVSFKFAGYNLLDAI